ncbi:hypothetical protein [Nocardia mexicana]|uniref:NurA domain-containing protein n=1 Tax=Nocardia mexicana TaxID=279262 RepID=A0A370HAR4_9NOCA|nr:hypothetical protein [Nocardia mexicana]RDI53320.1 hypothetical protein DFR68_103709 [Nocardia mexicana]
MPYQGGERLTSTERASKLGHLEVVKSPFVKQLVDQFERPEPTDDEPGKHLWTAFDPTAIEPLNLVLAVDGSFQPVTSDDYPPRSLAFIKTALVRIDRRQLDRIDKELPHPVLMKALMAESALQSSTVLPLRNIRVPGTSNYHLVRTIVRDSFQIESDGLVHETLKWLAYRKWRTGERSASPQFRCPHCPDDINGLPYDADAGTCNHCGGEVYLSDMIGFHLEMGEDQAPDSVASAYMLMHETLLLFSVIRHFWDRGDQSSLSNVLLIKDGPLSLRGQYSKLVDNIRDLLAYAKGLGCPIHLIGQEKSGRFVDHLREIERFTEPKATGDLAHYAVLSHRYVREDVDHAADRVNPYGLKTNYGEKVLVKLDPHTSMVLSVPTGAYNPDPDFPSGKDDMIGLDRILATLPRIISYQHEGALVPIALAHGVASLSSYPSAAVLKLFAGL